MNQAYLNIDGLRREFLDNYLVYIKLDQNDYSQGNREKLYESIRGCAEALEKIIQRLSPTNAYSISKEKREEIEEFLTSARAFVTAVLEMGELDAHSALMTAHDWWIQEDPIMASKILMVLSLPYFNPEDWLKRILNLNPVLISFERDIPAKTSSALIEATYCYIYGLFNGAAAICRSVMENELRNFMKLHYRPMQLPIKKEIDNWKLREILDFLTNPCMKDAKINQDVVRVGYKIKKLADKALHRLEDVDEENCAKAILGTRDILECIY